MLWEHAIFRGYSNFPTTHRDFLVTHKVYENTPRPNGRRDTTTYSLDRLQKTTPDTVVQNELIARRSSSVNLEIETHTILATHNFLLTHKVLVTHNFQWFVPSLATLGFGLIF